LPTGPGRGLLVAELDPAEIDAVVFDMGGVFVVPHFEPVGDAIRAAGVDLVPDPADTYRAHYYGVRGMTDRLAHQEVSEADRQVWTHYDRAYFTAIGVSEDSIDDVLAARDAQRSMGVQGVWRQVVARNVEGFVRIAASRAVAVVSNNDGTAVEQCLELEICQVGAGPLTEVAAIVDSTLAGVAKPDPRIFDAAVEALAVPRERILYVGDTVHADVLGATAAGLAVVQLDPFDLHADHEHWRVPDLVVLADQFG
jgi:FMN phosphatase YigB (HAD superfamily)